MYFHPIGIGFGRPELVKRLATDDVDQKIHRLLEIRNGNADVIRATYTGQTFCICQA